MTEIEEIEEVEQVEKVEKKKNYISNGIEGNTPLIYTINNFILPEHCKHFINISKDKIKQSLVSGDKEGFISQGRTGSNYWVPHDYDKITKEVANQISKEVDMPLENAESFQVIYYGVSEEYRQHYDGWLFDGSEKSKRNMKFGGQRMVTALVYLNDVKKGGGTKFTKLEKEVNAEKGKLLIFSNVHDGTNKRHELSEHAGMPVLEGEKWGFNLWFREKSRNKIYKYPSCENNNLQKTIIPDAIDAVTNNNNIKFSVDYKKNILNKEAILKQDNFFSSSEIDTIVKLCDFKENTEKSRTVCWIQNNKISDIISKISEFVNIDSSYFENICITKYNNVINHNDHLDAYDVKSESGIKYTKTLGQRLLTITGFLSKTLVNFPKLNITYECEKQSILYYNNCYNNTNNRDETYLKNYVGLNDDSLDKEKKSNINNAILFNIYVREISKTNDKILRLDKNVSKYLNKNSIPVIDNKKSLLGFRGNCDEVLEQIYTKSLQGILEIPKFKIVNKANNLYVLETIAEIKKIRNNKGFLSLENLDKDKNYFINEYNPVSVENVINPEIHKLIDQYFKKNIERGVYPLGDKQANRYKILDEVMTRLLHLEFLPLIEKITGKKMAPTYTYLSAYLKGTDLPAHTDRADCEFTCSYVIGKPTDSAWNIYVHKEKQPIKHKGRYNFTPSIDECIAVDCRENGLMIFNGTDHIHFREKLEAEYYNIVLLHYITKDN